MKSRQDVTCRVKGERDLFSAVFGPDVVLPVECAHLITRVTGRVVGPQDIEIVRIEEVEMDPHEQLINDLMSNIPQEWEASEGSAESIIVEYVREIERRLLALGGSLDRHPEDN